MSKKSIFIAFVVSLGGFLFGFDAGIISGVMSYVGNFCRVKTIFLIEVLSYFR